jgi:NADH:ubiquinone oxidoreductase subunit 5 (subunit L)/multisubunit Na+/H+ antiporter MnhA subunit
MTPRFSQAVDPGNEGTHVQLNDLAVLPIAVLLLGVAMQGLLSPVLSSKGKGWMAFGFTCASLVAVMALWPTVFHGAAIDLRLGAWDGPIALSYHVDGLSQLFALMGTAIGSAVMLFSVGYMAHDESATRFYIVLQIFIAALVNLVYSSNLLLMYASWEAVGVCSFLLVGFWYRQPEAASGARKVLVITHVAGYALLVAILLLFARTGTLLWTDPRIGPAFTTGVFVLMFIAAMAKSVQFPLNTWIPSAMAAPTPVSALLHSACYVTAGVYLVARMHSFTVWPVAWQATVVWVGTVTMVVGILFAMIQRDAKKMLAYSTVSQIGYMMLGLGLGTPIGIIAGLLHCLNHGLFKGGLFLGAGAVQHATGTRDMDKLGGLKRRMPYTTILWMVSAASIAGVPLFNGFVSKWLIYVAALQAGYAIPALAAWIVSILTMFTLMKATTSIFFGDDGEASASAHESPRVMLIGSGVLAVGCVVLGIAPQLAVNYAVAPALAAMGLRTQVVTGWFGLSAAGNSFYTTAGLVLALVSLVFGVAVYLSATRRWRPAGVVVTAPVRASVLGATGPAATALAAVGGPVFDAGAAFSGGEALTSRGRMRSSDFTASVARGLAPFYTWADPDRYLLAIWHWTLSVCAVAGRAGEWLERHALLAVGGLATVVGLIAAVTSGVVRTGSVEQAVAKPWGLIGAIGVALVALLLAQSAHADQRRNVWLAALCGVLVLEGLFAEQEYVRLVLLEAAAFGAVGLLVVNGVEKRARNAYLGAAAISALALVAGTILLPSGPAGLVLALLLVGFAVKLALVPAYLWLPAMARRTPAALVGLIVAVVDAAAFAELIALRQTAAWLFAPTWPWVAVALLTAVGGAGLMLAERDLKRMLAFSTMMGAGFVVLGVALAGPYGTAGALAAAAADSLAMGLLFTCLSAVETDGEGAPTLATRGLARRHPLASAAFVAGALTALGMPFTAGYAGHWRIYVAATGAGWLPLTGVVVATILAVLAYVRVIALVWWGGEDGAAADHPWQSIWTSERAPLVGALTLLFVVVVAVGLVPRVL